jgi:hypothetical protein
MESKITKGNVFKDLGFSDEEAAGLAMRVDLSLSRSRSLFLEKTCEIL